MIDRRQFLNEIEHYFQVFPICALVGPRQCGKTTLALEYAKNLESYSYFDLENPQDECRLEDPRNAFSLNKKLIIIDEIQRMPDLFPYLRVRADRHPSSKVLILASSSQDFVRESSESLAGRMGVIEVTPFQLTEVENINQLWQRGGFPKSYLSANDSSSHIWLKQYIATFLEWDLRFLGFNVSLEVMKKLWVMVAHCHGNILNYSELGRSLNVSDMTVRKYISILESALMIRLLNSWHENISKRQIKNPKIYIRDSGVLHQFLGVSHDELQLHPKLGASFEGFALEEIIRYHHYEREECYFWRTQDGAKIDLFVSKNGKRIGYEFKSTENVRITKSMNIAINDLHLEKITIITPGEKVYALSDKIEVKGINSFQSTDK